jgi:hypothetical protein
MKRYFRKTPPIPTNIYLSPEVIESNDLRIKVARHCHFPSVINILVNDENESVRKAAMDNEYWQLVGRLRDILGFDKRERKKFASIEGYSNILILMMFEDDLEIIHEILHNPAITVKMLALFMRFLKERGKGRKDEQIYEMARQVLDVKKKQIIKISSINKAAKELDNEDNIVMLLQYLNDDETTIRQVVHNILKDVNIHNIYKIVYTSLKKIKYDSFLENFVILSELITAVKKREDLKNTPITALNLSKKTLRGGASQSIADFFLNLMTKKRTIIVQSCAKVLTDFNNIILLAHCHVDSDTKLRSLAAKSVSIKDIINLANDVSTPRKVFKDILNILSSHDDDLVVDKVRSAHMQETHRLKESLKEMEISVQAYFDIIFQSLGYNQINEYHDVVKSITATEKQIHKFDDLLSSHLGKKQSDLNLMFNNIKNVLKNKANIIYFDTTPKTIKELEYIQTLIEEIFSQKEMGLSSLRPGTPEDIESEIITRARTIWQSAISIYLGRIKDLCEMIKKKITKLALDMDNEQEFQSKPIMQRTQQRRFYLDKENEKKFQSKQQQKIVEMEKTYKSKIQCPLTKACAVCGRRGCAAERFLVETNFFIKELLENYIQK